MMAGIVWNYSPDAFAGLTKISPEQRAKELREVSERLAKTMGRIDGRVKEEVDLQKERIAALIWCRNNGNPHYRRDA